MAEICDEISLIKLIIEAQSIHFVNHSLLIAHGQWSDLI